MVRSIIPAYKIVQYSLNANTGYYEKLPEIKPFALLPDELKVEPARQSFLIQQGARNVIHGRIRNKQYLFFTGLIPTTEPNLYKGDHAGHNSEGEKVKSLVLFDFENDFNAFTAYFFLRYYKQPATLRKFIKDVFCKQIRTKRAA